MKYTISVIIPTYNGEKTIRRLLLKIEKPLQHYTSEIIVIDSSSTDQTIKVINEFRESFKSLKIIKIKKRNFNHGVTRNLGVKIAKGSFIFFFSQDVVPISSNYFRYALEDIQSNSKVVAVFGKNTPYPSASVIQKIESDCRWDRIDKYINKRGILKQSLNYPFIPYIPKNYFIWYFFGNTASCFKRTFLIRHPFPRTVYGEDIQIGKKILKNGYWKIYDTRCIVYHSHAYTILEYYKRQKMSLTLRYSTLNLQERGKLLCKISKILKMDIMALDKVRYLFELFYHYLIKVIIIIEIGVEKLIKYFQNKNIFQYVHK